jgi:hypothetical protein
MKLVKGDIHRTLYKQPKAKQEEVVAKLKALVTDA